MRIAILAMLDSLSCGVAQFVQRFSWFASIRLVRLDMTEISIVLVYKK